MTEIIDVSHGTSSKTMRVALKNREIGCVPLYEVMREGKLTYAAQRDLGAEACIEKFYMWQECLPGCVRLEEGLPGYMLPALSDAPGYTAPTFLREYHSKCRRDTTAVARPASEQELLSYLGDTKREYTLCRTICAVETAPSSDPETHPLHRMLHPGRSDTRLVTQAMVGASQEEGYTDKGIECHVFRGCEKGTSELFWYYNESTTDSCVAIGESPEAADLVGNGYKQQHSLGFARY